MSQIVEKKSLSAIIFDKDEQTFSKILEQDNVEATAEYQWRLSLVISTFILAILAIPVSKSSPRKGRYAKVLPAILIYFIYSNFLSVSRKFVANGDVAPLIGMWWVHAFFLLLFIYLFSQQMGDSSPSLFKQKS